MRNVSAYKVAADGSRSITKSRLCQKIMLEYENKELIQIDDSRPDVIQVHLTFQRPADEIALTRVDKCSCEVSGDLADKTGDHHALTCDLWRESDYWTREMTD